MNLDGVFAASLSCDPAHAQFSCPNFIVQHRINMREQQVEVRGSLALEWRKRNKIYEWASPPSQSPLSCLNRGTTAIFSSEKQTEDRELTTGNWLLVAHVL